MFFYSTQEETRHDFDRTLCNRLQRSDRFWYSSGCLDAGFLSDVGLATRAGQPQQHIVNPPKSKKESAACELLPKMRFFAQV
jgi:hypothetical protein